MASQPPTASECAVSEDEWISDTDEHLSSARHDFVPQLKPRASMITLALKEEEAAQSSQPDQASLRQVATRDSDHTNKTDRSTPIASIVTGSNTGADTASDLTESNKLGGLETAVLTPKQTRKTMLWMELPDELRKNLYDSRKKHLPRLLKNINNITMQPRIDQDTKPSLTHDEFSQSNYHTRGW